MVPQTVDTILYSDPLITGLSVTLFPLFSRCNDYTETRGRIAASALFPSGIQLRYYHESKQLSSIIIESFSCPAWLLRAFHPAAYRLLDLPY